MRLCNTSNGVVTLSQSTHQAGDSCVASLLIRHRALVAHGACSQTVRRRRFSRQLLQLEYLVLFKGGEGSLSGIPGDSRGFQKQRFRCRGPHFLGVRNFFKGARKLSQERSRSVPGRSPTGCPSGSQIVSILDRFTIYFI